MNRKYILPILLVLCGLSTFYLFSVIHPLVPYDGDDWNYLSHFRSLPIPIWGYWNPSKVTPEIIQPLIGRIAAIIVYPFVGNIIKSIIFVSSLVMSFFVILVLHQIYIYLVEKRNVGIYKATGLVVIYYLLQFTWFKTNESSTFLYLPVDYTCLANYIIPGLMAQYVSLVIINNGSIERLKDKSKYKFIIFALTVYLSIFSNLFTNFIIPLTVCYVIINKLLHYSKLNIYTIRYELLIIITWIISALFEFSGGRNQSLNDGGLINNIIETLRDMTNITINKYVLLMVVVTILIKTIAFFISKNRKQHIELYYLIGFLISTIYLVLLSAKSIPSYILRGDVLAGAFFFLNLYIIVTLSDLYLGKYKVYLISLWLIVLSLQLVDMNTTLASSTSAARISPKDAYRNELKIINSIISADKEGRSKIEVKVPKYESDDNWPLPNTIGNNMVTYLQKNGVISKNVTIEFKLDSEINKKWGIN